MLVLINKKTCKCRTNLYNTSVKLTFAVHEIMVAYFLPYISQTVGQVDRRFYFLTMRALFQRVQYAVSRLWFLYTLVAIRKAR